MKFHQLKYNVFKIDFFYLFFFSIHDCILGLPFILSNSNSLKSKDSPHLIFIRFRSTDFWVPLREGDLPFVLFTLYFLHFTFETDLQLLGVRHTFSVITYFRLLVKIRTFYYLSPRLRTIRRFYIQIRNSNSVILYTQILVYTCKLYFLINSGPWINALSTLT